MTSTPERTLPPEVRVRRVDAGVEQRDGHAGAVETRDLEVRDRRRRSTPPASARLRRVRDPHREDARDLAIVVEQRERRRVEARREAVDAPSRTGTRARSARRRPPGARGTAPAAPRRRRPRAHLRLGRLAAAATRTRAASEGGFRRTTYRCAVETARTHAEHSLPARLVDRRARRLLRTRAEPPTRRASGATAGQPSGATRETRTHRAQGSEGSGAARRTAPHEAIIAALSVQSSSGANARLGQRAREAPEFAATPPTTAMRSRPRRSRRLHEPAHERPDDRALVRGREVGLPPLGLGLAEVADGVEQGGLEPREREVEARRRARPGSETPPDRRRARAGRSRRPPG